jgi:hypothetical protein
MEFDKIVMHMKVNWILFVSAFFLFACERKAVFEMKFDENFNLKARQAFAKDFNSYDFSAMSDVEKCILSDGVQRYLDEMNSQKGVIIDSFLIRNYYYDDLAIHFSFVSKRNRFYFIFLPILYEYYYSKKYYFLGESAYELRNPEYAIARINSPSLDAFLRKEVFVGLNPSEEIREAKKMMFDIFPELTRNIINVNDFNLLLKNEPEENRENVEKSLAEVIEKGGVSGYADCLISKLNNVGYIFFNFHRSRNVALDIYFIPLQRRSGLGVSEPDRSRHPECYMVRK